MVVAGALSSAVGVIQVFAPDWPDGNWIARTYMAGRAVGNMRQPNHLSSLLLWSIVAAVWLGEARVIRRRRARCCWCCCSSSSNVLSASRTGPLSVGAADAVGRARPAAGAAVARGARAVAAGVCGVLVRHRVSSENHQQLYIVFGGETRFGMYSNPVP